jgi:hypothetical protein
LLLVTCLWGYGYLVLVISNSFQSRNLVLTHLHDTLFREKTELPVLAASKNSDPDFLPADINLPAIPGGNQAYRWL